MVLEVSEQETETSPGAVRRSMSGDKGRPKLQRWPNTREEEDPSHHSNSGSVGGGQRKGSGGSRGHGAADVTSSASGSSGGGAGGGNGNGSNNGLGNHLTVDEGVMGSDMDYETITPLDGDRTPVNEPLENEGPLDCNNISPSDIGENLRFPAEPSDLQKGRIRESQMKDMYRLTYDCAARATDKTARCLDTKEWQQLRKEKDHSDKELYRKTFAQEEGNEDDGAVGVDAGGPSEYAFKLDEQAETYLEILPELAERLFQALDVIQEKKEAPTNQDMEDLERKFNHMAEIFQTEHTNLDQRMVALSRELKESQVNLKDISQSLKFSVAKLKEVSNSTVVMPASENLLDVMKTLGSTSDEFELYSSAMYRNARRMGMMDVQNRLHKMLDVMILYVHIIRTKYDNLKSDFDSLQTDFLRAKELLKENNITFTPNHSIGSLQNNNNIDEKQGVWDEGELESSHSDRFDDGESEPEKILRHLLGPKKSSAGLSRNKDILTLKQKKTNENIVVRYLSEGYEVWRRELFWPWNLEQTMKGLKQGFSVMLMILGLFVFLRGFLPSVSAIDDGCITNPSFFKGAGAYFSHCGHLSHDDAPVI